MDEQFTAFVGTTCLVSGSLKTTLHAVKALVDSGSGEPLLVFRDDTGAQVDFDLRGTVDEVIARAMPEPRRGPGRPKLGVTSREVSLLPRHWEWLEAQPHGISATLRRLVDEARKRAPNEQRAHLAREALSRVMWSIAGNLPDFEEATRALFAKRDQELLGLVRDWPEGIRAYVERCVEDITRLERAE